MRSEDRVLRGEHNEHVVERKRERDTGRDVQGLDDLAEHELERADRDAGRSTEEETRTLTAMRAILRRGREPAQHERHGRQDQIGPAVDYDALGPEQAEALRFLAQAVSGRDRDGGLVYAEDRRLPLDQALTALYPALAGNLTAELDNVRAEHDAVIDDIVALRDELVSLEDTQEEVMLGLHEPIKAKPAEDDGGAGGDEADEEDDDDAGGGDESGRAARSGDAGPDGDADVGDEAGAVEADGAEARRPGLLRRLLGRRGKGEPGAGS